MSDTHEIARAWRIPSFVELAFEASMDEGVTELRPRIDAYLGHGAIESLERAQGLVRRVCHWLADAGFDWTDAHAPLHDELARIEDAILASKGVARVTR
jgi:hypothetical protein